MANSFAEAKETNTELAEKWQDRKKEKEKICSISAQIIEILYKNNVTLAECKTILEIILKDIGNFAKLQKIDYFDWLNHHYG